MKTVFLLSHGYKDEEHYDYSFDIDGTRYSDTKGLGIYSSRQEAETAIDYYKEIKGFKDFPNDFFITEMEIDKNYWTDGFKRRI